MRGRRAFDAVEHSRAAKPNQEEPIGGLFGITFPAPSVPSPTSEAAADRVTFTEKGRNKRDRDLHALLALICSRESGFTSDELDAETGLGSGTICPRITELRLAGLIDTSDTIRRPTRRGSNAAVHFATMAGRARLERAA